MGFRTLLIKYLENVRFITKAESNTPVIRPPVLKFSETPNTGSVFLNRLFEYFKVIIKDI